MFLLGQSCVLWSQNIFPKKWSSLFASVYLLILGWFNVSNPFSISWKKAIQLVIQVTSTSNHGHGFSPNAVNDDVNWLCFILQRTRWSAVIHWFNKSYDWHISIPTALAKHSAAVGSYIALLLLCFLILGIHASGNSILWSLLILFWLIASLTLHA